MHNPNAFRNLNSVFLWKAVVHLYRSLNLLSMQLFFRVIMIVCKQALNFYSEYLSHRQLVLRFFFYKKCIQSQIHSLHSYVTPVFFRMVIFECYFVQSQLYFPIYWSKLSDITVNCSKLFVKRIISFGNHRKAKAK